MVRKLLILAALLAGILSLAVLLLAEPEHRGWNPSYQSFNF